MTLNKVINQAKKIFTSVEDISSPNDGCDSIKINDYYLFINTDGTFSTCHSDDFGFDYIICNTLTEAFNTIK